MWEISDALSLIREIEPVVRSKFNFCTALGGSVLHKGRSEKDLDVLLMPVEDESPNNEGGLVRYLEAAFDAEPCLDVAKGYLPSGDRNVWKGEDKGRRVDFFIYKRVEVKK